MITLAHRPIRLATLGRLLQGFRRIPRRLPDLRHVPDHVCRDLGLLDGHAFPGAGDPQSR